MNCMLFLICFVFILLCIVVGWFVCYMVEDWD